ncbi:MAG: hypothetical protein ABEK59_02550 [Halobacteria archaeon]
MSADGNAQDCSRCGYPLSQAWRISYGVLAVTENVDGDPEKHPRRSSVEGDEEDRTYVKSDKFMSELVVEEVEDGFPQPDLAGCSNPDCDFYLEDVIGEIRELRERSDDVEEFHSDLMEFSEKQMGVV